MAYKIKQFRYYGDNNVNNYPSNLTRGEQLMTGSIFRDVMPIVQLGIQYAKDAPIRFYINNSGCPILSHPYGLYELDLTGRSQISSLKFEGEDLTSDKVNEKNPIIIDVVYVG